VSRIIRTHLTINAAPAVLWHALLHLPGYSAWNPFITAASGDVTVGRRLDLTIDPVGGPRMTVRPWVTDVQPYGYVEWLGRMTVPGLLDGRHSFTLTPMTESRTLLQQSATFTGILTPLAGATFARVRDGFLAMNVALAHHVGGPVDSDLS
jgi:hypothetical protein